MDDTPAEYGAPVYLKGSHKNKSVKNDAVFVNLAEGDLKVTKTNDLSAPAAAFVAWGSRRGARRGARRSART